MTRIPDSLEATADNIKMLVSVFGMSFSSMAHGMSGKVDGRDRVIYPSFVYGLGRGNRNPTLDTLRRLVNVTGVTMVISPDVRGEEIDES